MYVGNLQTGQNVRLARQRTPGVYHVFINVLFLEITYLGIHIV